MQLEQVLKHYSLHPADSLKYRAACYLIANMPGHGWYEGEALDVYKQWIDSVYCGQSFVFKATLYEAFFQQPGATEGLVRYEDIEQLDSNFLITYIDSTFSAIRKRPWLKNCCSVNCVSMYCPTGLDTNVPSNFSGCRIRYSTPILPIY